MRDDDDDDDDGDDDDDLVVDDDDLVVVDDDIPAMPVSTTTGTCLLINLLGHSVVVVARRRARPEGSDSVSMADWVVTGGGGVASACMPELGKSGSGTRGLGVTYSEGIRAKEVV